ncbi:hypothetical protein F2Q69_00014932 [Brassica cretica]|uniref:BHLH domain-containing protein n=1 Tax=Brassica cretica TaxID=69181 RepID=A0A8S9R0R0_BRACR|nr:hypothetical protein F2Q69_00014932 [Brassica cretica]
MLGVSVQSEGNGVITKKLNHNASERVRRKKINSLFSSLRSCLPASDQTKKLSIPQTVSRSLKYIPELQEQVKKLIQKKEELLVRVSGQKAIEHYVEPQPMAVARYVSTISATKLGDNEVMVQISSSKNHNFSISNVLSGLEEDGFVLVDVSSSREVLASRENIILELVINQTKMCALVPPVLPNFGWPSTGEYENYYLDGEILDDFTVLDFPAPETYGVEHHQEIQEMLGVSVPSEGNGVVTKKLNHNASERDRRQKINSLFSSLRSCLPASDQTKKLSIPQTVSRSLKYIPELQEQVKKLIQKKEELLVRVSGQRAIEHYVEPQPKAVARYVSTISATKLGDNEVMVQISSSKNHNFSISNVLSGLEEDGFVLVDVSSSRYHGERLFYSLHLQMGNKDNHKLTCEELSQRILYLYEECENSFR